MGQACAPCEQAATGASAKQEVSWGTKFAESVLEKHFGDGSTSLGHVRMSYITVVWVCVCCIVKVCGCTTMCAPTVQPLQSEGETRHFQPELSPEGRKKRKGMAHRNLLMSVWHLGTGQWYNFVAQRQIVVKGRDFLGDVLNFLLAFWQVLHSVGNRRCTGCHGS